MIGRTADGVPPVPYAACLARLNLGAALIEQGGALRAAGNDHDGHGDGCPKRRHPIGASVARQPDVGQCRRLDAALRRHRGWRDLAIRRRASEPARRGWHFSYRRASRGGGHCWAARSTCRRTRCWTSQAAAGSWAPPLSPGVAAPPMPATTRWCRPAPVAALPCRAWRPTRSMPSCPAQPGVAPAGGEGGASEPMRGQQVTIAAGVPGLPAGTYTLLPSTFALLPGAFRVEINGRASAGAAARARPAPWPCATAPGTPAQLSIAGTGIRDALCPRRLVVTPADVLRTCSHYSETSFADFVRADAARVGVPRAAIEADAKTLRLHLVAGNGAADDFALHAPGAVPAGRERVRRHRGCHKSFRY
ncbi:hypothetical protein ACU4GD_31805 [Cupriavidus basilensis]